MAYQKKRNYRKRRYKPRAKGSNNKQISVWSDHSVMEKANRALALVQNVKRFINTEIKSKDVSSAATYDYNGTIRQLSAISQGDGNGTRDGNSIKPLNLTIRGIMSNNINAVSTRKRCRTYSSRPLRKHWLRTGHILP